VKGPTNLNLLAECFLKDVKKGADKVKIGRHQKILTSTSKEIRPGRERQHCGNGTLCHPCLHTCKVSLVTAVILCVTTQSLTGRAVIPGLACFLLTSIDNILEQKS